MDPVCALLILQLAWVGPAAPAGGGEPAGREIRIVVTPPRLRLAENDRAELEISVREADGAPVSGASLRIVARAGRVDEARELGPGRYVALYRAPAQRFPQLEIVVARAAGGGLGWTAFPLVGMGKLKVDTEPGATVTLEVLGSVFGPVHADAAGKAQVAFEAPPGIASGTLNTTDGQRPPASRLIDLGVPLVDPLFLVPEKPSLLANGRDEMTLLVFAVGQDNHPWAGTPPLLQVSAGSLEAPRAIAPGIYQARLVAPAGKGAEALAVRASLQVAGRNYSAALEVPLLEAAKQPPAEPSAAPSRYSTWGWLSLGAGAAALLPGVALLVMDGRETCSADPTVRCPRIYNTLAGGIVLVGLGAGLAATGIVLHVLDGRRAAPSPPALSLGVAPLGGGMTLEVGLSF